MSILLSIKPEYVDRIFDGTKQFEFRRSIFKQPIERVVIYATSPVCKVVGEFTVGQILNDDIASLWDSTHQCGGIARPDFFKYFEGRERGYAIQIKNVIRYEKVFRLADKYGCTAPQSFIYLSCPTRHSNSQQEAFHLT